jgi:hypothetical protein
LGGKTEKNSIYSEKSKVFDKNNRKSTIFRVSWVDFPLGDFYSDVCPKFVWIWGNFAMDAKVWIYRYYYSLKKTGDLKIK